MNYVGIDYHKKYSHVTAVNEEGQVLQSRRLDNDAMIFQEFFRELGGKSQTVLEASRTWGVLYDLLEDMEEVDSVTLAHPLKVRAIAEARIKTDKIDATTLAQLLRADLIPAAYIPGKETRLSKEMLRQRMFLVRMRTRLKNRIHVLLDRQHVQGPQGTDIFGKKGMKYLKELELTGVDGAILREDLQLLEVINKLIGDAEEETRKRLFEDERVRLLDTIPGLGPILASVIALEIDNIDRFSTAKKLSSYAGLVPSTYSSGGKTYHGRLLPMSNKWLKWALVEASWSAIRTSGYCRSFYDRVKRRKGSHTAAVALARRLAEIVWHVLKERRIYQERLPRIERKPTSLPSTFSSPRDSSIG